MGDGAVIVRVADDAVARVRALGRGWWWVGVLVVCQVLGFAVAAGVDGGGFDECEVATGSGRVAVQWVAAGLSLGVPAVAARWLRPDGVTPHDRLFLPLAAVALLVAALCWAVLLLPGQVC
ncbi:MAG: hypothetical protein S0880_14565 [Actinomycetota bacterium]|nr:hypothetical protein [Actinomycetota bacterium]